MECDSLPRDFSNSSHAECAFRGVARPARAQLVRPLPRGIGVFAAPISDLCCPSHADLALLRRQPVIFVTPPTRN